VKFCVLLRDGGDKMSIQLLADCVKKYKDKLSDKGRLDVAEKLAGRKDITTGIAFMALSKGDKQTAEALNAVAAEMTLRALSENPKNRQRADEIAMACDTFDAKKKELLRVVKTGELLAKFDEIRGKK